MLVWYIGMMGWDGMLGYDVWRCYCYSIQWMVWGWFDSMLWYIPGTWYLVPGIRWKTYCSDRWHVTCDCYCCWLNERNENDWKDVIIGHIIAYHIIASHRWDYCMLCWWDEWMDEQSLVIRCNVKHHRWWIITALQHDSMTAVVDWWLVTGVDSFMLWYG